MPHSRDMSWFTQYHAIDQTSPRKKPCIYFTKLGERCKNSCSRDDTVYARSLRDTIDSRQGRAVDLDLLQEYVLYNCCKKGQHRRIINEDGLLEPLSRYWRKEIRREYKCRNFDPWDSSSPGAAGDVCLSPSPSSSSKEAVLCDTVDSGIACDAQRLKGCEEDTAATQQRRRLIRSPSDSTKEDVKLERTPSEYRSRYSLRSLQTSEETGSSQIGDHLEHAQPKFRPHKENPRPTDTVFHKIQNRIKPKSQYSKSGRIYIFDRDSSPGYLKIGFSAISVGARLAAWSKCGYRPNLLFSTDEIPHARRVESLAHYELIKEWRREDSCVGCGKTHQEWFEIEPFRAKHVVEDWAEWMRLAEPYDFNGFLKFPWLKIITDIDRDGQPVTAKALLEHYQATTQVRGSVKIRPRKLVLQVPECE